MPLAARMVLGLCCAALAVYAGASLTGRATLPWWERAPAAGGADVYLSPGVNRFGGPPPLPQELEVEPTPGGESISVGVGAVGLAALALAALARRKPGSA